MERVEKREEGKLSLLFLIFAEQWSVVSAHFSQLSWSSLYFIINTPHPFLFSAAAALKVNYPHTRATAKREN